MTLLVGWSFATESTKTPNLGAPMRAAMAYEDSEWGADRGAAWALTCPLAAIRSRPKARPDPVERGQWAAAQRAQGFKYAQLLNEPNLVQLGAPHDVEGWPATRRPDETLDVNATAISAATWLGLAIDAAEAAGPHGIALTPFSPGVGRPSVELWLRAHAVVAARCRALVAHCYGEPGQMWDALEPVLLLARELDLPVIIGEAAPRADQDHGAWGRDDLPAFADRVAREAPEVELLAVFAPLWDKPDGGFTRPVRFVGTAVETWLREWVAPQAPTRPIPAKVAPAGAPAAPSRPGPAPVPVPQAKPKPSEATMPIIDLRGKLPVIGPEWPQQTYHDRPLDGIVGVTLHYTAGPPGQTMEQVAAYQISAAAAAQSGADQPFPGFAYTMGVDEGGALYICNDLVKRTWHSSAVVNGIARNRSFFSIVYTGKGPPNAKQIVGIAEGIHWGETQLGRLVEIEGHGEQVATPCPKDWPTWRQGVERELARLRREDANVDKPKLTKAIDDGWALAETLANKLEHRDLAVKLQEQFVKIKEAVGLQKVG